jgi:hypothetical protein
VFQFRRFAALFLFLVVAWSQSTDAVVSGNVLDPSGANVPGATIIALNGPEIVFRSQPHGTFKFLFNAIYLAGATPATLP